MINQNPTHIKPLVSGAYQHQMVRQFLETGFHKPHSISIDPKNATWIIPDDLHEQLPVTRAVADR